MKLWLSIIITFIIQELVSMNAVLLNAHQQNYNIWLISLIFVLATIVIISLGFGLGKFIQKRFKNSRIVRYSEKKVLRFESALGYKGSWVTLVILGIFNFNYINAFLASWLDISFKEVLMYLLLGDLIWYLGDLLLVMGVNTLFDASYSLYIMLGLSVAITLAIGLFHRKLFNYVKTA